MFKKIINLVMSPFKKEFWIEPFPSYLPAECFDCKKLKCSGCEFINK